jgi:hypothetical protein
MEAAMSEYDLFGGQPPHQRHSETSREAAEEIQPKVGHLQGKVFAALRLNPGTDEELMYRIPMAANTLRPRRRELQLMGLIEDSGYRRKTRAGKYAVIWRVARLLVASDGGGDG